MIQEKQAMDESLIEEKQLSVKPTSAVRASFILFGFVMLLTGIVMFFMSAIDVLANLETMQPAVYLLASVVMYKVGWFILQQCATLKRKHSRRKPFISKV